MGASRVTKGAFLQSNMVGGDSPCAACGPTSSGVARQIGRLNKEEALTLFLPRNEPGRSSGPKTRPVLSPINGGWLKEGRYSDSPGPCEDNKNRFAFTHCHLMGLGGAESAAPWCGASGRLNPVLDLIGIDTPPRHKKPPPGRAGRRGEDSGIAAQATFEARFASRAFFTWATMAENAAASVIARSERILRSASMPAAFKPSMKRE